MSILARHDLNSRGDILKKQDKRSKPKCKLQKQTTFTPKHYQLESGENRKIE